MINKVIQCVLSGLLALAVALPIALPSVAKAEGMSDMAMDGMRKKRYRYRKRTHRVQVGLNFVPWSQDTDTQNMLINLNLLYGYNGGYFEVGPNVDLIHPAGNKFEVGKMNLNLGIWGEVNFIKNTRKKKFIPALGLKVNYALVDKKNHLLLSPHLAIKLFPASRTGLIVNLGYDFRTSFNKLFQENKMGLSATINYAHYFHF